MKTNSLFLISFALLISLRAFAADFTSPFGGKNFSIDRSIKLAKMADNDVRLKQINEWGVEVVFADAPDFKKAIFLDGKEVPKADVDLIRESYASGQEEGLRAAAFYLHNKVGFLATKGKVLERPFDGKAFMVVNTEVKPLKSSTLVHEFLHHERQLANFDEATLKSVGVDKELWSDEKIKASLLRDSYLAMAKLEIPEKGILLDSETAVKENEALMNAVLRVGHYVLAQKFIHTVEELDVHAATMASFEEAKAAIELGQEGIAMMVHIALLGKRAEAVVPPNILKAAAYGDALSKTAKYHLDFYKFYKARTELLVPKFATYFKSRPELANETKKLYEKLGK